MPKFEFNATYNSGKPSRHLDIVSSTFEIGESATISNGGISSPQIDRLCLLLMYWQQEDTSEMDASTEPWSKLVGGLRKSPKPESVWVTKIFGDRDRLKKLVNAPNTKLLRLGADFQKTDVIINLSDANGEQLSLIDAVELLEARLNVFRLPEEHIQFMNLLLTDLRFSPEKNKPNPQIVAKSVWLGYLSRLEKFLNDIVSSGGIIGNIVSETAEPGGGFTRDSIVRFNALMSTAEQRLRFDFQRAAKLVQFDTKGVTASLKKVWELTGQLEKHMPCDCRDVEVNYKFSDGETLDEKFVKINEAAEAASVEIHNQKTELHSTIETCKQTLVKLAKLEQ